MTTVGQTDQTVATLFQAAPVQVPRHVTFHFWPPTLVLTTPALDSAMLPPPSHTYRQVMSRESDDSSRDLAVPLLLQSGAMVTPTAETGRTIIFFNNKYVRMNKFTNVILLFKIQPFLSVYFNGKRTGSGWLIKTQ